MNGKGRTALITGGTRGIGLGIALELARVGFDLLVNGVRESQAVEDVLIMLRAMGVKAVYARGDVSATHERAALLETAVNSFGNINVLVNNAGIAPAQRNDILHATEESFDHLLKVNLKGPYFLTQLVANHMIQKKSEDPGFNCCIINVSSVSATVASVNRGEYCISKAGVAMSTQLWAARLGEFDIPVYEIQPGIVKTDMTAAVTGKYDRLIGEGLCVQKRWGLPEDVGKVAAAMAMGYLPYSTGQVVRVDGGMTLQRL